MALRFHQYFRIYRKEMYDGRSAGVGKDFLDPKSVNFSLWRENNGFKPLSLRASADDRR